MFFWVSKIPIDPVPLFVSVVSPSPQTPRSDLLYDLNIFETTISLFATIFIGNFSKKLRAHGFNFKITMKKRRFCVVFRRCSFDCANKLNVK